MHKAECMDVEAQLPDRDTLINDSYKVFSDDQDVKGIIENIRNDNF